MDIYKEKYEKLIVEYDRLNNKNNFLMQRCNNLKTMLKEMRLKRNALIIKLDAFGNNYMELIEKQNAQTTERLKGITIDVSRTLCSKNIRNNEPSVSSQNSEDHKTQKLIKNDTQNISSNNLGHIIKALQKNNLNIMDTKNYNLSFGIVPNDMFISENNSHKNLCNLKKNEVLGQPKNKVKRAKNNKPIKHQLAPKPKSSIAYTPVPISCLNANMLNNLNTNAIILTNIQPLPVNNQNYYSLVSKGNVYLLGNSSLNPSNIFNSKNKEQSRHNLVNGSIKPITCSNYANHILPVYTSPLMTQSTKVSCHPKITISNFVPNMTFNVSSSLILTLSTSKNSQLTPTTTKGQFTNTQTTTSYHSYNDYLDSLLNKTVVSNLLSDNSNFVTFGKPCPFSTSMKPSITNPSKDNVINAIVSHPSSIIPKVILPKTL